MRMTKAFESIKSSNRILLPLFLDGGWQSITNINLID